MKPITENHIEHYAIEELQALGYGYVYGPEIERIKEVRLETDTIYA